jgi:hypothetical protein
MQVFNGLKPEIWGSNFDQNNGLLLRCPTLSYKNQRLETSPVYMNVGSEKLPKGEMQQSELRCSF